MSKQLSMVILVFQMLLVAIGLTITNRFQAQIQPDSPGYIEFPFHPINAALVNMRTPGYPCFLKLVEISTGSYQAVPVAQYVVFCGAVLVFFFGLQQIGCSSWMASLIAGSLLGTNIVWLYVQTIMADTLAAAAAIFAIGLVLQSAKRECRNRWILAGIVGVTTAGWLIRPAYLFLVATVPILSTTLKLRGGSDVRASFREIMEHWITMTTLVCLPVLLWCLLRLSLVQSFGVVSFGGFNLVGITGQFLQQEEIRKLPEDLQPLALQAFARLNQLPPETLQMQEADTLNYLRIEYNYDSYIWNVFTPAAHDVYGKDNQLVNAQLRRIATAILWIKPRHYAVWLVKATRHGIDKLTSDIIVNPFGLALTLTAVISGIASLLCRWYRGASSVDTTSSTPVVEILFVSAVIYAVMSLAVTIIVCPPIGRMTDAASLLFMPLISAVCLRQIVILAGSFRRESAADRF